VRVYTPALHNRVVPMSIADLARRYATTADCHAWAEPLTACPRCGSTGLWWHPTRLVWRCQSCGADARFAAITAWESSHVPLPAWFEVAWHVAEQPVTIARLQRLTRLARTSLHRVLTRIRGDATHWANRQVLSGTVEVDETFLGWNGLLGRASRPAVMMLTERRRGGLVLAVAIPDTTRRSLERVVKSHVASGSHVITDAWPGYNHLGALGYNHTAVNIAASGNPSHQSLNAAHSAINQLKKALKTYWRPPELRNLPLYLGEWSWRYSHRSLTTAQRWALLVELLNERRTR
jgi:ISXO2-like transposase domain